MKCPTCGTWTEVLETRTRKTDGTTTRRYQCAKLHRFTTEEKPVQPKEAKRAA
jgi:transcriptional regulator NrdR family protein